MAGMPIARKWFATLSSIAVPEWCYYKTNRIFRSNWKTAAKLWEACCCWIRWNTIQSVRWEFYRFKYGPIGECSESLSRRNPGKNVSCQIINNSQQTFTSVHFYRYRSVIYLSHQMLLLLLLLHLITHPTKCYTNSKVRALSEKTNSEQVRLQVFRKSRWTNRQVPQFDRQLIPTAGTSNSKGSQTPIRPVARHNKIPTNSGSQSRPTRLPNPWCKKQQGKLERDL